MQGSVVVMRGPSFRFAITTWGTALLKCRVNLGLSYRDVADRVGVSKGLIKAWEKGEGYPNTATQLKRLYGSMHAMRGFENLLPESNVAAEHAAPPEPGVSEPNTPPEAPQDLDDPRTFPEALRLLRIVEGFHQYEVAELLSVSQSVVSKWESGENVPIQSHYERLVELFDALREYPRPPGIRDIPKPVGPLGLKLGAPPPRGPGATPNAVPPDPRPPSSAEPSADSPPPPTRAALVMRPTALTPAAPPWRAAIEAAGIAHARALHDVMRTRAARDEAREKLRALDADVKAAEEAYNAAEQKLHEAVKL